MAETNSTSLPDYVIDRDKRANAAGVTLEKRRLSSKGKLTSWYRGTTDQLAGAGMITDPKRVKQSSAKKNISFCGATYVFHPVGYIHDKLTRMGEDDLRLSISNEPIPIDTAEIKGGIKVYWFTEAFERGPAKIFVAPDCKTLIDAGIAPADINEENWMRARLWNDEKSEWENPTIWHVREDSGLICFETYPEIQARLAQQERDKGKFNFSNVEDFREWLVEFNVFYPERCLERYACIETKGGEIYELPKAARDALEAAWLNLRRVVENMQINVRNAPNPQQARLTKALRNVPAAKADTGFQNLMRRITSAQGASE